jgi:hypothetical protein
MAAVLSASAIGLPEYLSLAARRPFVWGEFDCFLFCADWIVARFGVDPAQEFRGAYDDEKAARRLMGPRGGTLGLAEFCLARVGFLPTLTPREGDVGLADVATLSRFGDRCVGAICARPDLWWIKTALPGELVGGNFPIVRAWTK